MSGQRLAHSSANHGLDATAAAELDHCLLTANSRYQLANPHGSFIHVVSTYTRLCSPRSAPVTSIPTVALFMYLLSYFNDEVCRGDLSARIRELQQGLAGQVGGGSIRRAGRALAHQIQLYPDAVLRSEFLEEFRKSIAVFRKESLRDKGALLSLESYERQRHCSIAVQPFLNLWKLVSGLPLALSDGLTQKMSGVEALCREVHFLANDLYSVDRDLALGQANAVAITARVETLSLEEARALVEERHTHSATELAAQIQQLRLANKEQPGLSWWLDLIEGCVQGNALALNELSSRYAASAKKENLGNALR